MASEGWGLLIGRDRGRQNPAQKEGQDTPQRVPQLEQSEAVPFAWQLSG